MRMPILDKTEDCIKEINNDHSFGRCFFLLGDDVIEFASEQSNV